MRVSLAQHNEYGIARRMAFDSKKSFAGKNAPIGQEKRAYELPHSSEDEGEIVSPSESHLHEVSIKFAIDGFKNCLCRR